MKILVTGGLGFVGRYLSQHLLKNGHQVIALGRSPHPKGIDHSQFQYMAADTTVEGDWQQTVSQVDAVINLAGQSIFHRWDDSYKGLMYDSRVLTTRHLVSAIPENREMVFLSTSAVGYYGDRGEDILTESEPWRQDFLGTLSRDWEAEALKAERPGVRVALMRLGVVLGRGGGAFAKMEPAFKLFVGGPMGNGAHWFPWIHMADLIRAIHFLLEERDARGPFNLCAPEPVRNSELAETLGRVLDRPAIMSAPKFMIRLLLGELVDVLLSSTRAVPENLLKAGFTFRFPDIESALLDLVNN
ncbi:MAG: TIGR01777 family oxidoreductase [Desulfobacterales bacterium]|nr:TIGR01777 family oxidoreductase [Desulfobacterales bacterium]